MPAFCFKTGAKPDRWLFSVVDPLLPLKAFTIKVGQIGSLPVGVDAYPGALACQVYC